jgi:hypothetical protein
MEDGMNQPDSPHLSDSLKKGPESESIEPDAIIDWELAQDRVLLYLRALNVGPDKHLTLAMQAYERAGTQAKTNRKAVTEAMISLRQILVERNIIPESGIDFCARIWHRWARRYPGYSFENSGFAEQKSLSVSALPPIHRRPMPPATLQFRLRRRVLPRPTVRADGRSLNKWFYLTGALITILLIIFFGT